MDMREILVKAQKKNWRELLKEERWIEGDIIHEPYGVVIQYYDDKKRIKVVIDPETLCQYTGLKDKNGNRICENDIVKCNKRKDGFEFYKVLWRKYYADFGVEPLEFGVQYPISLSENKQDIKGCNYEVAGNIFDNIKLLRQDGV